MASKRKKAQALVISGYLSEETIYVLCCCIQYWHWTIQAIEKENKLFFLHCRLGLYKRVEIQGNSPVCSSSLIPAMCACTHFSLMSRTAIAYPPRMTLIKSKEEIYTQLASLYDMGNTKYMCFCGMCNYYFCMLVMGVFNHPSLFLLFYDNPYLNTWC